MNTARFWMQVGAYSGGIFNFAVLILRSRATLHRVASALSLRAVALGALGNIVGAEIFAWLPSFSRLIVGAAASIQPKRLRDRLAEEWKKELELVPGPLMRLWKAFGLLVCAPFMSYALRVARVTGTVHDSALDQVEGGFVVGMDHVLASEFSATELHNLARTLHDGDNLIRRHGLVMMVRRKGNRVSFRFVGTDEQTEP